MAKKNKYEDQEYHYYPRSTQIRAKDSVGISGAGSGGVTPENEALYYDALAAADYQKNPYDKGYLRDEYYRNLWGDVYDDPSGGKPGNGGGGGGGGGTTVTGTPTTSLLSSQITAPSHAELPEVTSKYGALVDELVNRVLNRDPFSYDYETDPAYQQYAKSYGDAGRRAMQDTLAQVSARTGGLASSYAGSASQQAYNNYMARLADKVPELRQLAYQMYQDEGDNLRSDLSMLSGLDDTSYSRSADAWNRAYQLSNDEYERNMELAKLAAQYNDLRGINGLGIDTSKYRTGGSGSGSGGTSKSDARSRYEAYLKMGGSLDNLDPELLEATGLTPAELLAYATYYADQGTETPEDPFADMPYFQSETEANKWLSENGIPNSAIYVSGKSNVSGKTKSGSGSSIMDKREWEHYKSAYPSAPESAYTYYEDYVNDMARLAAINFGAIK